MSSDLGACTRPRPRPRWTRATAAVVGTVLAGGLVVTPAAGDVAAPTIQAPPTVYEGTGSQIVPVTLPDPDQVAIARITHSGADNFVVWELDGDLADIGLLVNVIGDYSGVVPVNLAADHITELLEITADGAWRVEIDSVLTARLFDSEVSGAGDDVVAYMGDTRVMAVDHQGDANFVLWSHGDETELVVNEIGAYSATVPLPGPAILVINANGPWSIRPG